MGMIKIKDKGVFDKLAKDVYEVVGPKLEEFVKSEVKRVGLYKTGKFLHDTIQFEVTDSGVSVFSDSPGALRLDEGGGGIKGRHYFREDRILDEIAKILQTQLGG